MNHFTPTQELLNYTSADNTKMEPPLLKPQSIHEAHTNYLLDKLQEESAECIQAVSKIRRFGATNKHPDRNTTNLEELVQELEDVLAIIAVLESLSYIDLTKSQQNITSKAKQLLK
jgi:NTP pyrophosphatase (non-canonical NTP hydrolase)